MVALALAAALLGLFFFSLILFLVLAHWMLAMAPVTTLFLGLILCLSPMTPCQTMLHWPHTSALVAYSGGTRVGHGVIRTLFLLPNFLPSTCTLNVGHGPVRTLFLGLILCLSPMTPCENMFYWPQTRALVAYNGTRVGHGAIRTLFLKRYFVPSTCTLDVGYWPC